MVRDTSDRRSEIVFDRVMVSCSFWSRGEFKFVDSFILTGLEFVFVFVGVGKGVEEVASASESESASVSVAVSVSVSVSEKVSETESESASESMAPPLLMDEIEDD